MAPATSDLLPRRRYRSVRELSWDESVRVETSRGGVEVGAIQVKHWGARLGSDTHRGYNGYDIRREGRTLLFGGDTAYTPRVRVASSARSVRRRRHAHRRVRSVHPTTARPSRPSRWPMRPARGCSCRSITKRFG